ncbi:MAG: prephenate dehydrogenase/arogenate dehydrogenase family protein [Candidatus Levybacteria bacterium]|nr:prephenate dehydrogenase/arogenate dehydrogenase family protein [Candidatus Levybacteria bacterium]
MKKVSIIGFGRFGKTLYRLLKDDFELVVYNRSQVNDGEIDKKNTIITKDLNKVYESEVIFYAIPISEFEKVIKLHKKYFRNHLLIDVLSVKLHPAKIFDRHLTGSTQALLTHPMFGPDSTKDGFKNRVIIVDKFKTKDENYRFWKKYFEGKGLKVIEMSAREHDKIAARSQGLTHFIGRLLEEFKLTKSPIDSLGTKKLHEIIEQTSNDTWQLFTDLQHYNPYTTQMRLDLGESFDKLYNKLLPKQVSKDYITYGIQGGKGSFNEEAIFYFLKRGGITNYKIKYLYTSNNVLKALHKGEIDIGQFAIHNSIGGIVGESIDAMANYKFKIVDQYAIKISHALMIRKDANYDEINTIMSHPQVFAQCKTNLLEKYPHLKQLSGKNELIDHAVVAKQLSINKLQKHVAVMGSKVLAQIYNLKVIEDNLQDAKENYTSFLQVSRL